VVTTSASVSCVFVQALVALGYDAPSSSVASWWPGVSTPSDASIALLQRLGQSTKVFSCAKVRRRHTRVSVCCDASLLVFIDAPLLMQAECALIHHWSVSMTHQCCRRALMHHHCQCGRRCQHALMLHRAGEGGARIPAAVECDGGPLPHRQIVVEPAPRPLAGTTRQRGVRACFACYVYLSMCVHVLCMGM
jgi:hypothetical protein